MHPYIPHLIADINVARREENPEENFSQSMEKNLEEIEAWVSGNMREHTFGYYCGLKSEDFPPPEQLTEMEMKVIRKEFEKMIITWNVAIHLPKKLPIDFAYKLMVNILEREVTIFNSGCINIDFCTGYAPDCELQEYCPFLEIWNTSLEDK